MKGADRPTAVRRWLRRPLWWGAIAVALVGGLFFADVDAARSDERTFDQSYRVTGRVLPGWNGARDLDVAYRHPLSGVEVRASTYVWSMRLLPTRVGPVLLDVSRTNPTDVMVAGDRFPATVNLPGYAPLLLLPFLVWLLRCWTAWKTERLMASDIVAYAMTASAQSPGILGRRWRLHLYPLDAGPSAHSVCSIPLIAPLTTFGSIDVTVKGSPRPYGRVVARDSNGMVLWPSGRALRYQGRPAAAIARVAPMSPSRVARWLLVAGIALFIAGMVDLSVGADSDEVREMARTVTATITASRLRPDGRADLQITYEWDGISHTGTVLEIEPPAVGNPLIVQVDPESPDRVWSTTQDTPPGTSEGWLAVFNILVGSGLLMAGGIAKFHARRDPADTGPGDMTQPRHKWRGLELVDGRLWFGMVGLMFRKPRVRFEPEGLVLVEHGGDETCYRWDDHVAAATHVAPASQWELKGIPPSRVSMAALQLKFGRKTYGYSVRRRLATQWWRSALGLVPWQELPALVVYLAATPSARAGLGLPDSVGILIGELATKGWRRPHPPGEPLFGDRLDLHLAVDSVLGQRMRRFGGRAVRGETSPAIDELVVEVIAKLPELVRPRVDVRKVAERIERHLTTGRWSFDVLCPRPGANPDDRRIDVG